MSDARRRRTSLFAAFVAVLFVYAFLRHSSSAPAPETWYSLSTRGVRAMNEGRYEEAEWDFERAAELASASDNWERGTGLQNLGKLRHLQGRFDESEQLYRSALEILEDHPRDPAQVALLLNDLGASHATQGAMDDALPYLQRAVLLDEIAQPASPQAIGRLRNYAVVLAALGRHDDADAAIRQADQLERRARTTAAPVSG